MMARSGIALSRWHQLIDGFQASALDFYAAVEAAVGDRSVPYAVFERVEFKEGTIRSVLALLDGFMLNNSPIPQGVQL